MDRNSRQSKGVGYRVPEVLLQSPTYTFSVVFHSATLFDLLTVHKNAGFLLYENSRMWHDQISELVTETLPTVGLKEIDSTRCSETTNGGREVSRRRKPKIVRCDNFIIMSLNLLSFFFFLLLGLVVLI